MESGQWRVLVLLLVLFGMELILNPGISASIKGTLQNAGNIGAK